MSPRSTAIVSSSPMQASEACQHAARAPRAASSSPVSSMPTHKPFGLRSSSIRLFTAVVVALGVAFLAAVRDASAQGCTNSPNSCFVENPLVPGCSNPSCCALVCSIEPACCDVGWDGLCVALATKFCSDCGNVPDSCFSPHAAPSCSSGLVCEAVCAIDPDCCATGWSADCVAIAVQLTDECGEPATGSCLSVHENPNCADPACCNQVCAIDPNCCTLTWDQTCVDWASQFCFTCGSTFAGSCCFQHEGPYCDDRLCCEAVCAFDPFCCTVRWDSVCADLATAPGSLCNLPKCRCGNTNPLPGQNLSCKAVHLAPGCSDFVCCDKVCTIDGFCCLVTWDFTCTQIAASNCALTPNPTFNTVCSTASGSCFAVHPNPGCSDDACCGKVCTVDPSCCDIGWDADCVTRALSLCNGCGDIESGSCFFPHGSPGCFDRACCDDVCVVDPSCCAVQWDMLCVLNAGTLCVTGGITCGDPRTRPCSIASFVPYCEDEQCCALICARDFTCCERAWDETCAAAASISCNISFPNCPSSGSALVVHGTPGCAEQACCEAVCSVDPVCCNFSWNAACVDAAKAVCIGFGTCPAPGRCDTAHGNPGCSNPTCCTIVCTTDPTCCEISWTSACASLARTLCVPLDSWPCPCIGSCFEPRADSAGCNDELCCAGVCNIDPTCCTTAWDAGCVGIARATCCSSPVCGNSCAGDCFESHPTPYCNDASCCEAVCRFDDFCCTVRWDSTCALSAATTCEGGCGLPVSGNCFAEHGTPGCADPVCCEAVCAVDSNCCDIRWDQDCVKIARSTNSCTASIPTCGQKGTTGCNQPHPSPSCSDADCCAAVCAIDSYCCEFEWDITCVEKVYSTAGCERYQPGCGEVCSGDCCSPHDTPWCNDQACCAAVCVVDDYCCNVQWDLGCVQIAQINPACSRTCPDPPCGSPEAGNCCLPHNNANCSDQECCEAVCATDPLCCSAVWDALCASEAGVLCKICQGDLFCGSPEAGNCCATHPTPFCANGKCCAFVCSIDELCCSVAWDAQCVAIAAKVCGCTFLDVDESTIDASIESGALSPERYRKFEQLLQDARLAPPAKSAQPLFPSAAPSEPEAKKPADAQVEKAAEKAAENAVEKAAEKPVDAQAGKPADSAKPASDASAKKTGK